MSKSKPELKLVEDTGSQLDAEDLGAELPPQQGEMPFAVVEGEPVTQLPRDLYIPPDALQVFLEAFEGPLDLLLYLIRKQNLDILDIPIAEITRQYMKYIEVMADLQLELAGEYLLMAAMLAEIKSRMLLPRPPSVDGQEEDDPRAELVRRLQEYERFKKAAEDIDKLSRLERDTVPASAELEERKIVTRLPDVTLKEMLDAFRDVLSRAEKFAHHHISRERLSQRERMTEILSRLQTVAFFEFTQLFRPEEGRMGVTVTFIAILELMKEGLIEIVQAEAYAPIHVRTAQRHLKVVQGGAPVASETADAENAAALAQPELAGENDIPDEFDEEPAADPAASAVEAAVADVAAASSIAVDSIESDSSAADAALVVAAVSEAVAATESAIENIPAETLAADATFSADQPTVAAHAAADDTTVAVDQASVAELPVGADDAIVAVDQASVPEHAVGVSDAVAAEQIVAVDEASVAGYAVVVDEAVAVSTDETAEQRGIPDEAAAVSTDEAAEQSGVLDEVVVAELSFAVAESDVVEGAVVAESAAFETTPSHELGLTEREDPLEAVVIEETTLEDVPVEANLVAGAIVESVATDDSVRTPDVSAELDTHTIEEHTVEEHVVEEHEVEEHVVPEHVVEEHVVPTPSGEQNFAQTSPGDFSSAPTEAFTQPAPDEAAIEAISPTESLDVATDSVAPADATDVAADSAQFESETVAAEAAGQAESVEFAAGAVAQTEAVDVAADAIEQTDAVAAQALGQVEAGVDEVEPGEVIGETVGDIESETVAAQADEQAVLSEAAAEAIERTEPVEVTAEASEQTESVALVAEAIEYEQTVEVEAEAGESVVVDVAGEATDQAATEQAAEIADGDVGSADLPKVEALEDHAPLSETSDADGLSVDDDSVTGTGSGADNSDAEPSR